MSDSLNDFQGDISSFVETTVLSAENKLAGGWNDAFRKGMLGAAAMALLLKLSLLTGISHGSLLDAAHQLPLTAWHEYEHVLSTNPIATKAATSATVYTIGDVIAQRTEGEEDLDYKRVFRSMMAGMIGHGPLSHFWYNLSEGVFTDVLHFTSWWAFLPKIVADQAIFGPFWNNSYILLLGLMKQDSFETIFGDMKRTTVPLILSGLKLWPFVHCITYGLIPVENRLLWVDAVEILWVTILATQAADASREHDDEKIVSTEGMVLES
jgi:protein Mpv17